MSLSRAALGLLLLTACDRMKAGGADASTGTVASAVTSSAASAPSCGQPGDDACILQGIDYQFGHGLPKDEAKAATLYKAACDAKNKTGCAFLGPMYAAGAGGMPQQKWMTRGGRCCGAEFGVGKKAALYTTACEVGSAFACDQLGWSYEYGGDRGVAKDPAKSADFLARATKLYAAACAANDLNACAAYGGREEFGRGVAKNVNDAVAQYEKSCTGGDGSGCYERALVYEHGAPGYPKDAAKAGDLYVKGCDGGEDMACENGGHIYEFGQGVKSNRALAHRLYKVACDRGDSSACGAEQRTR